MVIRVRVAEPERTNGKRAPGETKSDAGVIFCMPGIWAARAFQPARNMRLLIATGAPAGLA